MKKILLLLSVLLFSSTAFATVNVTTTRVQYDCDGVSTDYAYTFKVFAEDDLLVVRKTTAGVDTSLVLNTNYTVTGVGTSGGNVVLTSGATCGSGETLTIIRQMDLVQETDYEDGGGLSAETIEADFDKARMIDQQLQEQLARSVKLATSTELGEINLPPPGEGDLIGWNTAGTGLTTYSQTRTVQTLDATSIENIDELRLLTGIPGASVVLRGYYADGDGGGGPLRVWDAASTATDNGGSIIKPTAIDPGDPGRWVWEYSGAINVKWFGAKGDGVTNDTTVVTAAIDSITTGGIHFPYSSGSYVLAGIAFSGKTDITFTGQDATIKLNNEDVSSIFSITACKRVRFDGLNFVGTSDDDGGVYNGSFPRQGIRCGSTSFLEIENCTFSKFSSHAIYATTFQGATFREGAIIRNNKFFDCPFDSATTFQSSILFDDGAEYSLISGNHFYQVPAAFRLTGGANLTFADNFILNSTQERTSVSTGAALIYINYGFNSGKVILRGNYINHNKDCVKIAIFGDPAKPQNVNVLESNYIVANTGDFQGLDVIITDAPRTRIVNNTIRSNATVTDHLLRLVTSSQCYIDGNDFVGGSYALFANASTDVRVGKNFFEGQDTGVASGFGTYSYSRQAKPLTLKVTSAGAASTPWDATIGVDNIPATWTVSKGATGTYTITHNMGSSLYSVNISAGTTGADRIAAVQIFANSFVVRLKTTAAAAVDDEFVANVTLGVSNPYAL